LLLTLAAALGCMGSSSVDGNRAQRVQTPSALQPRASRPADDRGAAGGTHDQSGGDGLPQISRDCWGQGVPTTDTAPLIEVMPEDYPPPPELPPGARLVVRERGDPAPIDGQAGVRTGIFWGIEGEDQTFATLVPPSGLPVLAMKEGCTAWVELATPVQPVWIKLTMVRVPEGGDRYAEPFPDDLMTFRYDRQQEDQGPCGLKVTQIPEGDGYWEFQVPSPGDPGAYYLAVEGTWSDFTFPSAGEPRRPFRKAFWLFGVNWE
jgi:hypothetical protein